MFTLVAAQRKRREIDPILSTLRRCREALSPEVLGPLSDEPVARDRSARVNELLTFLTMMDGLAQRFFETHRGLRAAIELLAAKKPAKRIKSPGVSANLRSRG
jgi:hypothetical protein